VSCHHQELAQQRHTLHLDCTAYISSLRTSQKELIQAGSKFVYIISSLNVICSILERILKLTFTHPEGYHFLLGSWTPMHIDLLLPQLPTHCKVSSSLLRKHLTAFSKLLFHSALLMVKIRHCLHNKQSLKPIPTLSTQRRLPAYLSGASTRSTTTCPSATKSRATRRRPSKKSSSRTTNSFLLRPSSLSSSAIVTTSTHLTTHTNHPRQTSLLSFFTTSSSSATLPPLPVPPEPPPCPTYPLCDLP
jgi:hypothetical protein